MTLHEASLEEVFLTATLPENNTPSAFRKAPVGRTVKAAEPPVAMTVPKRAPKSVAPQKPIEEDEDEDYKPLFGRKEKESK